MKEDNKNVKTGYKKPVVYGIKESEVTAMASNRYMAGGWCCLCSGHGTSRA